MSNRQDLGRCELHDGDGDSPATYQVGPDRSELDPAIRTLRTASDLEDDDPTSGVIDDVHDPKIADAKSPEVGVCQLDGTRRSRRVGEREDRTPESGGVAWWKATEPALGGGCELDPVCASTHASSGP